MIYPLHKDSPHLAGLINFWNKLLSDCKQTEMIYLFETTHAIRFFFNLQGRQRAWPNAKTNFINYKCNNNTYCHIKFGRFDSYILQDIVVHTYRIGIRSTQPLTMIKIYVYNIPPSVSTLLFNPSTPNNIYVEFKRSRCRLPPSRMYLNQVQPESKVLRESEREGESWDAKYLK